LDRGGPVAKVVFSEKNQEVFAIWRVWPGGHTRENAKVFCFFSSEKKTFP
jgi:hypothetical protein